MVNVVLVVPFRGLIEQEPFSGGLLMIKLIELELISEVNEYNT